MIGNNHGADAALAAIPASFDHAEHGGFPGRGSVGEFPHPEDIDVGRADLAANKRLVGFNLARKHRIAAVHLNCEAKPMQHETRRLLRHAERAAEFVRRNAVAVAREHPHGRKPLVEANRGVLKDRPDLDGELPTTMAAAPCVPVLDLGNVG